MKTIPTFCTPADCSNCEHSQLTPYTNHAGIDVLACMKCHELHPMEPVKIRVPTNHDLHLVAKGSEG